MTMARSSKEALAAVMVAAGMIATITSSAAVDNRKQSMLVLDRTVSHKTAGRSACGKCASAGACGISYHERRVRPGNADKKGGGARRGKSARSKYRRV